MSVRRASIITVVACLGAALPGLAQGLRMSPDFLPLEVGNLWSYQIEDASGRVIERFEMEILDHRIVEGLSLYVFSRLPFAPDATLDDPVGVHFDRQEHRYVYTNGAVQGALFPARGQGAEVVESDESGRPLIVELDYGDRVVTLERGVGITGGRLTLAGGIGRVSLVGARVGADVVGQPTRPPATASLEVESPVSNVMMPSDTAPRVALEADPQPSGHRFVLRVKNPTGMLMPFDFTTSQSFDFIVSEPETGREVWRWARRMFFSRVLRTEAIRAEGEWTFQADWNHVDNDLEPVAPGTYLVRGVLAAETPFESAPVEIEVD